MESFGNKLYTSIVTSKNQLFLQGEMAQITYISFEESVKWIDSRKEETIVVSYPIGLRADNTPIMCEPKNYSYLYSKILKNN